MITYSNLSFAVSFNDLDGHKNLAESIDNMTSLGYVNGFPDGTFRPEASITRAQFVSIINKMNKFEQTGTKEFADLKKSHWAYKEIMIAVEAGYISGYPDGTFRPDKPITNEQIASMINNLYHLENNELNSTIKDLSKVSSWAIQAVVNVVSNGIMELDEGRFEGTINASRGNSVYSLNNLIVFEIPTVKAWMDKGENTEKPVEIPAVLPPSPGNTTNLTSEEVKSMNNIINDLSNFIIPDLTSSNQIEICNLLKDSIQKYLNNSSYDVTSDVENIKVKIRNLSEPEYDELFDGIRSIQASDIVRLNDKFQLIDLSKLNF